jgi:type IV pili sensor histidine kinase/response regulator
MLGTIMASILMNHGVSADSISIGRYQAMVLAPDTAQADALGTLVMRRFPDDITTVGAAIGFLLQETGYLPSAPDPCQALLFAQPLPAAHRLLGSMTVRHALAVLAGPAYRPVVDTLYRRVTFELTVEATGKGGLSCYHE